MKKIKIDHIDHPYYNSFKAIYGQSFPVYEKRSEIQQEDAFKSPYYNLEGFLEQDCLIGFIAFWEFETYLYIEHFAIHPEERGKGTGKKVLKDFMTRYEKPIILEIDPVKDKISEDRLLFYRSLSFLENPYQHTHPPYMKDRTGHVLTVLSSQKSLSQEEYSRFDIDLKETVMA